MKDEILIIENLITKLNDKDTLLGKQGHSWVGLLRSEIRFSMAKLIEVKEALNWIK